MNFAAALDVPHQPRRLARAWVMVRDGLPSVGRYRRYLASLALPVGAIWAVTIGYLTLAPDRFDSRMTLILPGSGAGGSMNLDSIGQASSTTSSAFSSPTLSPTENYKRLLASDVVMRDAEKRAGDGEGTFPEPTVKLTDQTNLIEVTVGAGDPKKARKRLESLRGAFLDALDKLREDEAAHRMRADETRIAELKAKADAAQAALLDFQNRTGLVSVEQFAGRVTELDRLKANERDRRVALAESGAIASQLSRSLAISLPQARIAMQLKADPEFRELLGRYAKAVGEGTERGATLGEGHAAIEELSAEKQTLREALARRGAQITRGNGERVLALADLAVSDTRERLFETLTVGHANKAGNGAALAELRRQIGERASATELEVGEAARLAELNRDLRVAEAVFSSALARLDTNKADPFASYPLVQTLEAPSLPRERASPSPLIAIAGAAAASIFVLLGFLLLWLRQPIIRKLLPNA